jgi:hypothetical protein
MRASLTSAAELFGLSKDEFKVNNWSGISFRKGALSALAEHLQPHQLAAAADHASVETSYKYYLSQTIRQRASNTARIEAGFLSGSSVESSGPLFGAPTFTGPVTS